MNNLFLNRMNSRQGIIKRKQGSILEISIGSLHYFKILLNIQFGVRQFFLTIPKPLKQHPILKKIIHSAIFKNLGKKLPDPSNNHVSALREMLYLLIFL
jgi:hypothetical protein